MEHADHDISTLLKESAEGDTGSCKKLYEHLVEKVFAYVRFRTATHEQAIDLTQDVLIDFFTALPNFTYQSRAQLYAYVFVITKRKLAQQYALMAKTSNFESNGLNEQTIPDSELQEQHEVRYDVAHALTVLDETAREIVVLHHWARYTFGEIALLVAMTESAVRVRHHRALAVLREQFKE